MFNVHATLSDLKSVWYGHEKGLPFCCTQCSLMLSVAFLCTKCLVFKNTRTAKGLWFCVRLSLPLICKWQISSGRKLFGIEVILPGGDANHSHLFCSFSASDLTVSAQSAKKTARTYVCMHIMSHTVMQSTTIWADKIWLSLINLSQRYMSVFPLSTLWNDDSLCMAPAHQTK